jgi:hypothetical protein
MSSQYIVNADVNVQQPPVEAQPLDLAILGVTLTAPQDAAWGPNLIREVERSTWQDTMDAVGIPDGDPTYEFVQLFFSQNTQARALLLGKLTTPVQQVIEFDLGVAGPATDGLYRITINGENYDHTASSETRAQVITALIATFPGGQAVSAAAGGTPEKLEITADNAGAGFVYAASAPAPDTWAISVIAANVGMGSDLTAWNGERKDWYLPTRTAPFLFDEANGFAAAVESFERDITAHIRTDSATDPNAAVAGDSSRVAVRLSAFGYQRTVVWHIPAATDVDHAAIISARLATEPGTTTWANHVCQGIDGEEWETGQLNALAEGPYASFDNISTVAGGVSLNVRTLAGISYDLIRGADYLKARVEASVLTLMLQEDKVPYTGPGFGRVGAAISAPIEASVPDFIVATKEDGTPGFTVTIPTVASQTPADRANRIARGFGFTAQTAGAVEVVRDIDGILFQ